jgi:aspartate racemase
MIGLIGGTGWISTVEYYRLLNQDVGRRLGGLHAAQCLLYSLDYADIHSFNQKGDLLGVYFLIREAAIKLQKAGVEALMLCANTLHLFADDLQKEINLPLIHIADATARTVAGQGLKTVALLGTRPTMEQSFYTSRLSQHHLKTLIPEMEERTFIHQAIQEELLHGLFKPDTRARFQEIIRRLAGQGAEGVILGCTEIPLLIKQEHAELAVFNTLEIHVRAAVDFCLA